tara:strand:+ start:168 stop:362 length:195 start_codon:yes stop_codon:yes gene_type:complete
MMKSWNDGAFTFKTYWTPPGDRLAAFRSALRNTAAEEPGFWAVLAIIIAGPVLALVIDFIVWGM